MLEFMFNMKKIGKKISLLRKEHNMTQMELADKMAISYQAVSNWERGNSMPDISKLPELAEIFGISLDELLGEKSPVVEAAIHNNLEECLEREDVTEEDVANALPILKPDQAEELIEQIDMTNFEDISKFLPFMFEDDVRELAYKTYENGKSIEVFLPFMFEDDIRELAYRAYENGKNIEVFLPFMCQDDVKELALHILKNKKQ